MINYHEQLVKALEPVGLPVYYEMQLSEGADVPCLSYMELSNMDDAVGDTLGYSIISYQIKVWGRTVGALQHFALKVDEALRPLGFTRAASTELIDMRSTMLQKVMTYEAFASENY